MVALMLLKQKMNLVLVIGLLSQSELFLKSVVSPNSEDNIIPYLSLIRIDIIKVFISFFYFFMHQFIK